MLILLFLLCFLSTPPCSGLTKVVENKQRKFLLTMFELTM
jgi:hypothetical protein